MAHWTAPSGAVSEFLQLGLVGRQAGAFLVDLGLGLRLRDRRDGEGGNGSERDKATKHRILGLVSVPAKLPKE